MKNLVLKMKYLTLALLVAFSVSCSPEDGEQGPPGEQGIAGTNGTNGNANVTSVLFENQTINNGNTVFALPN
ncbi:hypothetical protein N7U66_08290 [Lacinutrix neustonica]|uniref:Collagen-like protein n=1 Tax=Lacinutrix neustonica TaxID=2980107 RepID=A0A9E8MYZ6_9FLAO|nr:hypothetical protein [Lacinutrix neustonica]WAC03475.1 hypothetical protein N7U66_08290 [Lacinutrix neustonica]